MAPAVTIEALPAGYGDCLLLTCARGRKPWRMLVDTGPDECWPTLRARLAQIPANAQGERHIDLAVVTHVDHDHIGGAKALFSDRDLGLSFGDVWFNAPAPPGVRSVAEGRDLALLLGGPRGRLPWNKAWGGRQAVVPASALFFELPQAPGEPKLTLLSPTPKSLAKMFKVWQDEIAQLDRAPVRARPAGRSRQALDLKALAAQRTPVDRAPANGSSITLLLEHKGASILLGADAHPTVLVPALKALAASRGVELPLPVDVFKLSHHGSQANLTTELMRTVRAQHCVVSTNGAVFGHPDAVALARVVTAGGAGLKLWFNYRTVETEPWGNADLQRMHRYQAKLPSGLEAAVSIRIGARSWPVVRRRR